MMDIVACFDHGFVMPTGVMVYSVCANNADVDIVFHLVVDESVTENDKKDLVTTITAFQGKQVRFYEVSSQRCAVYPLLKAERLTRATYYRLFLAEILPSTVDKVLYLDGDCIVRHTLLPLWQTDISSYAVGAVFDVSEGNIEFYNRLRYPPASGYFNAGVLLINLVYWRQHHVLDLFLDYMNAYRSRIKYEDQDILNVILQDKKMFIPAKYNFQTSFLKNKARWDYWKHADELKEAMADPVIVHFTLKDKPWDTYARHPHPYRSTFLKYQKHTKWEDVRLEKRTRKTIIRNFIDDMMRQLGLRTQRISPFMEIQPVD